MFDRRINLTVAHHSVTLLSRSRATLWLIAHKRGPAKSKAILHTSPNLCGVERPSPRRPAHQLTPTLAITTTAHSSLALSMSSTSTSAWTCSEVGWPRMSLALSSRIAATVTKLPAELFRNFSCVTDASARICTAS